MPPLSGGGSVTVSQVTNIANTQINTLRPRAITRLFFDGGGGGFNPVNHAALNFTSCQRDDTGLISAGPFPAVINQSSFNFNALSSQFTSAVCTFQLSLIGTNPHTVGTMDGGVVSYNSYNYIVTILGFGREKTMRYYNYDTNFAGDTSGLQNTFSENIADNNLAAVSVTLDFGFGMAFGDLTIANYTLQFAFQ